MLDAGLPVGMSADATRVASYNPWVGLHWLVTGRTVGGLELCPPHHLLGPHEMVRLYTAGSAWFTVGWVEAENGKGGGGAESGLRAPAASVHAPTPRGGIRSARARRPRTARRR